MDSLRFAHDREVLPVAIQRECAARNFSARGFAVPVFYEKPASALQTQVEGSVNGEFRDVSDEERIPAPNDPLS